MNIPYYNNKKIWITGASSGIGKALAIELSKHGAYMILTARSKDKLEETKATLHNPEKSEIILLDMADSGQIDSVTNKVLKQHGHIDILINNAGISQRSLTLNTEMKVYHKLMNINYFGVIQMSKLILPSMMNLKSGNIITITSVNGKLGSYMKSGYASSKHALHGFFDALRLEHHKDNIKVTLVCPGFVNTNVARNALTADGSQQTIQDAMTENGLNPDVFVKKMIKAIKKEKFEAYIGKFEAFGVYVQRLSPRLIHWLVLRSKVK